MKEILVLGGYGNFGTRICDALAKANLNIIICGRDAEKAAKFAGNLKNKYPLAGIEVAVFDVNIDLDIKLAELKPLVVINTCGPFQNADYSVAKCCIKNNVNYIDLADARDFVCNITSLNAPNILVVSGASTVPGLSSAVLEKFKNEFSEIDSLVFGVAPGQKASRGLATTEGILSYVGKHLKPFAGNSKPYGWQNIYSQKFPEIGNRLMANCDVPDLDILPVKYGIKRIKFSAGMENKLLHMGIWGLSWLIRTGIPLNLAKYSAFLLKTSHYFDRFGTDAGGMHVIIKGKGLNEQPHEVKWFIIAKSGDGPQIPCVPAVILAKKLVAGQISLTGAIPCVALVTLNEYMAELSDFDIKQYKI